MVSSFYSLRKAANFQHFKIHMRNIQRYYMADIPKLKLDDGAFLNKTNDSKTHEYYIFKVWICKHLKLQNHSVPQIDSWRTSLCTNNRMSRGSKISSCIKSRFGQTNPYSTLTSGWVHTGGGSTNDRRRPHKRGPHKSSPRKGAGGPHTRGLQRRGPRKRNPQRIFLQKTHPQLKMYLRVWRIVWGKRIPI